MDRLSMASVRENQTHIFVALCLAALIQGGVITMLNFNTSHGIPLLDLPAISVEFVTLPPPVAPAPTLPEPTAAVTNAPSPAPTANEERTSMPLPLPALELPGPSGPTTASEGVAALRDYFCIEIEGDAIEQREDCGQIHMTRPGVGVASDEIERAQAADISARRAADLGLGLAPGQVAPVADTVTDPYAPDDTTFTNPVEDVRGEIFW